MADKERLSIFALYARLCGQNRIEDAVTAEELSIGLKSEGFELAAADVDGAVDEINSFLYARFKMPYEGGFNADSDNNAIIRTAGGDGAIRYYHNISGSYDRKLGGKEVFEDAELYILNDAMLSAKFLTEYDKMTFTLKIEKLIVDGLNKANENFYAFGNCAAALDNRRRKKVNDGFEKTLCTLYSALECKQVRFSYFYVNKDGEMPDEEHMWKMHLNPLTIVFDDGNYYLCGTPVRGKERSLVAFRIDRITEVEILDEECNGNITGDYYMDDARYLNGVRNPDTEYLGLYGADNEEYKDSEYCNVVLKVRDYLLGDMYDKFGSKISVCYDRDGWYTVQARLLHRKSAMQWFTQFGNDVKILSPDIMIGWYKDYLNELLKNY